MSRPRTKTYTDIVLTQAQADRIKKGFKETVKANEHLHSIYVGKPNTEELNKQKDILKRALKAIARLEGTTKRARHFGRKRRQDANGKWHWYNQDGTPVTKG